MPSHKHKAAWSTWVINVNFKAAIPYVGGFPGVAVVKNPPANAGDARDMGSVPKLGRSPGGGHGHPLQYSCLENPVDRGACQATVHGLSENQTRLSPAQLLLSQSCPTLCNPMDCSPPGSSVHGILQARILEWVAMPSSRGSSQSRDRTWVSYVSCIGGVFSKSRIRLSDFHIFNISTTWEATAWHHI